MEDNMESKYPIIKHRAFLKKKKFYPQIMKI